MQLTIGGAIKKSERRAAERGRNLYLPKQTQLIANNTMAGPRNTDQRRLMTTCGDPLMAICK